jgi:cytochrome P450 family 6
MDFFVVICLVLVLIYLVNKYLLSYWSRHGFKQIEPVFLFGDAKKTLTLNLSIGVFFGELYEKYKSHRVIGVYMSYLPILVVNDPLLVQDILVKNFNTFHDRPMPVEEVKDPLSGHLFSLAGQKWRDLRIKLSPTFTSGKLKGM